MPLYLLDTNAVSDLKPRLLLDGNPERYHVWHQDSFGQFSRATKDK